MDSAKPQGSCASLWTRLSYMATVTGRGSAIWPDHVLAPLHATPRERTNEQSGRGTNPPTASDRTYFGSFATFEARRFAKYSVADFATFAGMIQVVFFASAGRAWFARRYPRSTFGSTPIDAARSFGVNVFVADAMMILSVVCAYVRIIRANVRPVKGSFASVRETTHERTFGDASVDNTWTWDADTMTSPPAVCTRRYLTWTRICESVAGRPPKFSLKQSHVRGGSCLVHS